MIRSIITALVWFQRDDEPLDGDVTGRRQAETEEEEASTVGPEQVIEAEAASRLPQ